MMRKQGRFGALGALIRQTASCFQVITYFYLSILSIQASDPLFTSSL